MAKKIIITTTIVILVAALVFTICCLAVPSVNAWIKGVFNKEEVPTGSSIELVKLETGQVIKGVKFDTTKEPDLSVFEPTYMCYTYPLFDYKDDEGDIKEEPIICVMDFGLIGKAVGFDLQGKVLMIFNEADDPKDSIIYADKDINITGMIAEELDLKLNIKKGWNDKLLNENGELLFEEHVEVLNTYYSGSWNGVYMGALESEWCFHKEIKQGACTECNKCFHENLDLFEKCRVCGSVNNASQITRSLEGLKVGYNGSIDDILQDKEIIVRGSYGDLEYTVIYPDFRIEDLDTNQVGMFTPSIYVGNVYCGSIEIEIVCNDDYHNTLDVGSQCSSCGKFSNYLTKIIQIDGLSEFSYDSSLGDFGVIVDDWWNSNVNTMSISLIDTNGNTHIYNSEDSEFINLYLSQFILKGTVLVVQFAFGQLSDYKILEYNIHANIVNNEEV